MWVSAILVSPLLAAIITLIWGLIKKDRKLKVISAICLGLFVVGMLLFSVMLGGMDG